MELRLQPKPEVEILPANQGIVSRKQFFVKKQFEKIKQYFFPAHFIRNWKPKAELLYPSVSDETAIQYECDFNRDIQNCFVEDNAEEVFLRTPPPCFVVIGKYGASVSKLSKELANEFGSVLIQVDDIINRLLQTQTETSKTLDRLLRFGVSLTLNFILALLSYVAHTAEARHRGYVLCGLPCIPESYDLSVDQQFNYLFTWDNKPTVFINVLFDDEDLIKERTSLRCEVGNLGLEKCIVFYTEGFAEDEDGGTEEDTDGKLQSVTEDTPCSERDIDISPSRPWVQLPRDEESQVWSELELFDNKVRPAIKLIISRVDPQYFITVDSRVENEFDIVLARLSLLQIWKAPVAVPFISPKRRDAASEKSSSFENLKSEVEEEEEKGQSLAEDDEVDADIKRAAKEPPATAFLTLFAKNTISPKFRWELSHYNYICPVTLREGELIEGKSEFAVIFMKYIYFLRNEESMLKFIRNPRAYVLPVRPAPLCRFIILGYPYSLKTSLAKALSSDFSIPLIDASTVLKNDLDRKKNIYQEFCRQKAECREIIRLNALAWQDWRMEEEHRIFLIEEWVAYIQTLLTQRIEQFYCRGESDGMSMQSKELHVQEYSPSESSENVRLVSEDSVRSGESSRGGSGKTLPGVEVLGVALNVATSRQAQDASSPSDRIIKALKHEDFDFNDPYLEVEANLFFSSLWNTFSNEDHQVSTSGSISKAEEPGEDSVHVIDIEEESVTVNWCSLLPPQSLSSFLMNKLPATTREKRQSFKIFLEAASKAYWTPCKLKTEFVKWRLPCFMDIPLCEMFLDNPILLLRYVPEWLKERPLIPDPVEPTHPSVLEAGRRAFLRAGVVTIKQDNEEVAVLLRDAIEKTERENMRVTGEVISPGGWVVDNMTLDLDVWRKLARDGVFADHIYILIDTDPEHRRIINTWCELNRVSLDDWEYSENSNSQEEESKEEETEEQDFRGSKPVRRSLNRSNRAGGSEEFEEKNLLEILMEIIKLNAQDDSQLDDIFGRLSDDAEVDKGYIPPVSVDAFSHHMLQNTVENWSELREETTNEEALMTVQTLTHWSGISFFNRQILSPLQNIPIGPKLQRFTKAVLDSFEKKKVKDEGRQREKRSLTESVQFFIYLLTLPKKIQNLKDWLSSIDRGDTVIEIETSGTDLGSMLFSIRKKLLEKFIKKPRELLDFENEEIQSSERRQKKLLGPDSENSDNEKEEEEEEQEVEGEVEEEEEDLRIFGECGPLCIVNLERGIFLLGKPQFSLRYFGKLYYFWNEDAKSKFIRNPQKYAPYYSVIRCYPPLRIFVTGPIGSGKTSLATSIARQCSLTYVDYPKFLLRNLVPHLNITFEKYNIFGESKLLLSEGYNAAAKLLKEKFMNAPYVIRQFWFENPVYEDQVETKNKFKRKLIDLNKPLVLRNYPELSYECLDSVSDRNGEEDISLLSSPSQEDSYMSMAEIKSIICSYFQATAELTDYCTERSTKVLWTTEPYLSQGFVLKSFPLRASDMKQVLENNWIPDLVLEILLPDDVIVDRNIDALMETWDAQLKQETIEERLLEDTLTSVQRICMRFRRNELLAQKREEAALPASGQSPPEWKSVTTVSSQYQHALTEKREFRKSASNLSSVAEEHIQEEIDAILKEEFPSLSFNPNFETYDAGKARLTDNLLKSHRRDMLEVEKFKSTFKDLGVPWIMVDSTKDFTENLTNIFRKLDKFRRRVNFKGEFAFTVKMEVAEKLLQQGYYFLSKFGRWCPVQVYRMKNPVHMFRPLSAKGKVTPIAYRNYIYFVGGENEKLKFIQDPVKYTFNEPHHPNIPLRVAVIGPPKCGKSTLSNRLGRTFDMKVVTMGSALRFVVEKMPKSTLAKSINNYLKRGCFLPLSFKVEALMTCLNDPTCVTQGFVFDGVPFDAALTQSLAERGKLPFVIISLVAEPGFGKTNRQGLDLSKFRLPYKNRINLNSRYRDWNDTYKRFAQWNQNTYNNLYEVNAKLNVVDIFYQAYDIIRKSFFGILYYVEYCVSDRALPLHHLCVGQHEYELRKSSFHNNCPVCWVEENKLCSSSNPPPPSGLVQYLNYFYWICSNHMEKFLKHPRIYVPPIAPPVHHPLPKIITRATYESTSPAPKVHGFGRCPVTRVDFPDVLDWEGSWRFAALYDNKVFLCKSKEMLDRFLSRPWRYCKANTEFEVNRSQKSNAVEQLGPPKVTSLPPIGFLEQTVADSIHECLQLLGSVRPVYPNLTPATTGCTFAALYLKVHNKRNKCGELEKQYFNFMLQHCKAYLFQVVSSRRPDIENIEEDTISRESSEEDETPLSSPTGELSSPGRGDQTSWLDLEAQADKKMWSAKVQRTDIAEMRLTSDDQLLEIPEVPKAQVVLRYQTYGLRSSPLPPVSNCLTFVYSVTPPLKIPEKFNYNSLYQPLSMFPSPYPQAFIFNPEKEFDYPLFKEPHTGFQSQENLWQGRRAHSDESFVPAKSDSEVDPNIEMMLKLFVPRFQLLDNLTSVKAPPIPETVQEEPIIFNPHRDYTYTLILSEFFRTTHVLRCFEWDESHQQLEYSHLLDRDLGLSNVQVEYFLHPQKPSSAASRKSIDSYMEAFDSASLFVTRPRTEADDSARQNLEQPSRTKSSLINFVQMIILEKLDELFARVSLGSLSYDSYEINLAVAESETNEKQISVMIREVLPYPPLPWDIISRPYYAYISAPSIFRPPILDNIAHERHFSLLDGIIEQNDEIRFVRYPSWVRWGHDPHPRLSVDKHGLQKKLKNFDSIPKPMYLVYDFFNMHWTSFLTYPFSWAYNKDVRGNFCEIHNNSDSPLRAQDPKD